MEQDAVNGDPAITAAVQAVLAGNPQAYATIVGRFQDSLMTVCQAILRDRQAAEELTQDVFVHAYQRLKTFEQSRPLKPWLVKIAYRLAQQRWRQRTQETARQEAAAQVLGAHDSSDLPDRPLLQHEQAELLWNAVYHLPSGQRTAVVLYYREGLSVEEVAEAMDISTGTVKTHLFRARQQLHTTLQACGFAEGNQR